MNRVVIFATVGAMFVVGGAGGAGRYVWTRTPAYSLKQAAAAVEHRDRYELEKYVDVDTLLQSAMADATDGNALAGAMSNAMVTSLKPQIIKAVEDGQIAPDSPAGKAFTKVKSLSTLPAITQEGRNAYFNIDTTTNGGAPFALKIHMTQVADGYWRVDRITNIKELRAAEAEEERLRKAAIAKANDEKLAKVHVVAKLHTSVRGNYEWEKKNRFQLRLENKGDKTISAMTGRIRFPAQGFDEGIRGDVNLSAGEAANYNWVWDVNRFMEPTVRIFALGETDEFQVEIDSITMSDGTKVRRGSDE